MTRHAHGLVPFVLLAALVLGTGPASGLDRTLEPPAPQPRAPRVPVSADDLGRLVHSADHAGRDAKKRLEELGREAAMVEARTLARGRAYVRLARVGLLPVGDGFEALLDHAARLERLRHGLEADLALAKRLSAERILLGKKLDELEARRGTLEAERQVLAQAETALRSAEERDLAFEQAFENPGHTAVYGGAFGPSDPSDVALGFAAQKGRLTFPIGGRTTIRAARRPSSDGPGLELFAPAGSVVRSVASGRVAFADTYAEYGRTVIVDHGRRHYTVSSGLGSIDVKVGDDVTAGERLGTLGSSDASGVRDQGPALYFEIRVGKDTVEPADWFGI